MTQNQYLLDFVTGTLPANLKLYRKVKNWLITQRNAVTDGRSVSLNPPDTGQLSTKCKETFESALEGLRAYKRAGKELESVKGSLYPPEADYEQTINEAQKKVNKNQDIARRKVNNAIKTIKFSIYVYQIIRILLFFIFLLISILAIYKFT
jgi:hypothetical protein